MKTILASIILVFLFINDARAQVAQSYAIDQSVRIQDSTRAANNRKKILEAEQLEQHFIRKAINFQKEENAIYEEMKVTEAESRALKAEANAMQAEKQKENAQKKSDKSKRKLAQAKRSLYR